MQRVTLGYLIGLLSVARGARPATITANTDARLRKTGNPNPGARKRSRVNVIINWKYGKAVNRQRVREGSKPDFAPEMRTWGRRLPKSPFVVHNSKVYLECKVERCVSHEYLTAEGKILSDQEVALFLPEKISNAEHQGVEKEILLRDYAIENIESIAIDGQNYSVDQESIPAELDRIGGAWTAPGGTRQKREPEATK